MSSQTNVDALIEVVPQPSTDVQITLQTSAPGPAGTVAVGTTTTGAAGTNASVTNVGTSTAAVLNFVIPQGVQGVQGAQGATGAAGAAATIAVGTTTTGAAGTSASVNNSGTSTAAVLNFVIPQGIQGIQGIQGSIGATGPGYYATSTTSLNPFTTSGGTITLTTQAGLAYVAGDYVRIIGTANSSNYFEGTVTSYSGTSMSVSLYQVGSSGTPGPISSWNVSLYGKPGSDGDSGSTWYSGVGAPSVALGLDGDYYLRTDTEDVYTKYTGAWSITANIKGRGYYATSSTSLNPASYSSPLTFTTQANLAYIVGDYVRLIYTGNSNAYFEGTVTAYSGTSMTITVAESWSAGGGPFTSWELSLAGRRGLTGTGGALGYYGAFSDSTTHTIASSTTAYPVTFNSTDSSSGISIGAPASRIVVSSGGTYDIQFSVQLENTATADGDATFWLRKNGVDISGTSGVVNVPGRQGTINGHALVGWNYVLSFSSGDYIELVWSASTTSISMPYYAPGTSPTRPSAASAILTVVQVMYTQVGPGYAATSSTSMVAAAGTKTFTTQTNLAYNTGSIVRIVSTASPASNYMYGSVTSYSGATLVVNVTSFGTDANTYSSWDISIAGTQGPAFSGTVLSDTVSSTSYIGKAPYGSATSASVWKTWKTVYTSSGSISSNLSAINIKWDDRYTATYT